MGSPHKNKTCLVADDRVYAFLPDMFKIFNTDGMVETVKQGDLLIFTSPEVHLVIANPNQHYRSIEIVYFELV